MTKPRGHAKDLRAAGKLAVEATRRVTAVVEDMHRTIASGPRLLGRPLALPARALTGLVYGHIRNVTSLVGFGVDVLLEQLEPLLGESRPGPEREAIVAALNGVLGDYLLETHNPLAIEMTFRVGGQALPLEPRALAEALKGAGPRLLVLIHGSSMNDLQWSRQGHDHGQALAKDLGFTPVYLHYNSGLHISTNGRELAGLLEQLTLAWPVPLEEIVLLGHSMGGLVARSACHVAGETKLTWVRRLRALVTLGTPHHGSHLEQAGSLLHGLLEVVTYSAPLARLAQVRSAGVTDLRYGNVLDAHWQGKDRFAVGPDARDGLELPVNVPTYAVAASTSDEGAASPAGDGLVPVPSALGRHARAELTLPFADVHVAHGAKHLDLLSRRDVYEKLRDWLRSREPSPS